ncbi:MAG: virulence factor TspB C-terminal domain-related protein [Methylococcales bacterium]|nr:virulence factor TspB C-terminal domain-related protein [Methylococcales bacterium]
MKTFLLCFLLLVSFNSHALVICIDDSGDPDSCVDEGSSSGQSVDGVNCYYNKDLGITQCNTVLGDGSLGGYWDPKTFTCSNFVAPVVGATGEITCPASQPVSVKSKTTPNPSKDDKACDPTKPIDPNNPNEGCASEETAKKTNDLLSEANSKLGSIAGSNSANTGLLGQILGTLRGIASQGTAGNSKDCPPSNVSAPSCPTGQVAGYYNGEFSCISDNGISCVGDACRTVIVSNCGVSSGTGTGTGSSGSGSGSGSDSVQASDISKTNISVPFSSPRVAYGYCPQPEEFKVLNYSYSFSYQPLCDLADSMSGIVIAMGAFSSLLIVVTAL